MHLSENIAHISQIWEEVPKIQLPLFAKLENQHLPQYSVHSSSLATDS